jgi:uncharacterized membrane protein (UPF0182 family)
MVVVAELVNPAILPSVVQRFVVEPQTLSRERPYIAHTLALTRRAYALDRVAERPLPANATISDRELGANRDVIRNVQLWDTDVLRPEIAQQQTIGSYYGFPNITVDRYDRGGRPEGMIVAERELDLSRLDPSGRTWANDRLAYSHGYGLVAVPAGDAGVDDQGKPSLRDVGVRRRATTGPGARAPRVLRNPAASRAAVGRRGDAARGGGEAALGRLTSTGVPLPRGRGDRAVRSRAAVAVRLAIRRPQPAAVRDAGSKPADPAASRRGRATSQPRAVPALGEAPEVAVVDGRIVFLAHGYTTSNSYPYSKRIRIGGTELNYVRASVVATVDAFSGRVTMYPTDPDDPIIGAWQAAFPKLFTPVERMPADVRAHLRYPRLLFNAQSRIWATYHIKNVDDFYIRADAWKRPGDVSGPIQRVGDVRQRVTPDGRARSLGPDYVLARLPDQHRQQLMLAAMFTPYSEENLSGYLTGTLDALGRPSLTQLSLPRSRRVLGPFQVSRQILASPGVSGRLRLLNQETTDLGERSVNIIEIGDPRVVPIGDSFLYVQSIYLSARGTGASRLRLVTVYLNGRVGYGRTLDAALHSAGAPSR